MIKVVVTSIIHYKIILIGIIILATFINTLSCHKLPTEPNIPTSSVLLELKDVSVKLIKLRLTITDFNEPREFFITRNNEIIIEGKVIGRDTIIIDTDIVQNENYFYKAYRGRSDKIVDSSATLNVTIGHGWKVYVISDPNNQLVLERLWGLSSNCIYAVGHNSSTYRNLWKWNGKKWSLFSPAPQEKILVDDIYGIWGVDTNRFWIAGEIIHYIKDTTLPPPGLRRVDSALIAYWNGVTWIKQEIPSGFTLFYIWGLNENNIYASGLKGSLYHYDGIRWKKISNDTTMDFQFIWGFNENEVYCTSRKLDTGVNDTTYWYFLKLFPDGYEILDSTLETYGSTMKFGVGLWGTSTTLYSWNRGIYKKVGDNWVLLFKPQYSIGTVRGISDTILYAAGDGRMPVYRYNGAEWREVEGMPYIPPTLFFLSSWIDEKEIFLLARDNWRTYIYHYK